MEYNEQSGLFAEFPPVPTQAWEEKINADLKGADYQKKLIWTTDEGFTVKPYYRAEDLQGLDYLQSLPGQSPYVRGNKKSGNNWIVRQDILVPDIEMANRQALDAIAKGAGAVGLVATEVTTHKQMNQLLAGIDLSKTGINFISSRSYPLTLELFIYEVNHRGEGGDHIMGSINFDPLSYLLLHGDFYVNWTHNIEETEYLLNTIQKRLPQFRAININGHYFQDSGSSLVQELGFSLASANEYLSSITEKGMPVDTLASRMMFSLATGSNYFMEIAKLRAMRLLWARLVEQYNPGLEASMKTFIHSSTALWNKTIYDPYVNMLRTTTEGMSAILGNADSVTIHPFDISFRDTGDFSGRIARNQQLVLKEESYLDKVADPAAGSYYVENLTDSIANNAWELFKTVEEKGGMIECLKTGFIQDQVTESRRQKEMAIAQRKTIVLGTNQYPNTLETMLENVRSAGEQLPVTAPYKTLTPFRISTGFEKVRLATEAFILKGNKRPSVFLFTMGNLAMLRARAGFSANFFGCAGYEIIDNQGFTTVQEGVDEALLSGAEIAVICSSDDEYPLIVPEIAGKLKKTKPELRIVVAGYPTEIVEMLKEAGVDDFIHIRSNLLDTLQEYQKILGIY
jgi:methylmalonyl-CoA mutase